MVPSEALPFSSSTRHRHCVSACLWFCMRGPILVPLWPITTPVVLPIFLDVLQVALDPQKEIATGSPEPNTSKCKASLLLLSLTLLIPCSQIGRINFLELPFLDKTNPQPIHHLLIFDKCHVECLKTSM